jgi:hypothetical protein
MHPTTGNRAADANLSPAHSDGTGDGATSVLMAAKSALEQVPLRVLLVGNEEQDFYLIREILERIRNVLAADLDHADPLEEAKQMLQPKPYGLGFVRARNRER